MRIVHGVHGTLLLVHLVHIGYVGHGEFNILRVIVMLLWLRDLELSRCKLTCDRTSQRFTARLKRNHCIVILTRRQDSTLE